jgi:hypothetical protein
MEKTKVVYSWIGPRGPIWNTELPNVYSFAGVTFEGQVNTPQYSADDTWLHFYRYGKDLFEIYPVPAVDEDDDRHFVIPFSLIWRINFESYFCGRTGLFEFAHTPWYLIKLVREKNGYIVIDYSVEAYIEHPQLSAMHEYFGTTHNIPLHKIIYLTGAVNATALYEKYCVDHNIPNDPQHRLTIIPYASSQHIFKNNTNEYPEPDYNTEVVPKKLFLSWNRRFRPHRIELMAILERYNVVDRSYISFSKSHLERPLTDFMHEAINYEVVRSFHDIDVTEEVVQKFYNRLPLILDGEEHIGQMCGDSENQSRPYYQSSLVSLITETNFHHTLAATLTEKSFKPLKEKHPFIILGVNGCLQALRDLGFRTFSEFWDESYDTQENPNTRMHSIARVIEQISMWSDEQILDFKRRVKPILEHNFNVLKNSNRRDAVEKVNNIIRGHHA